MDLTKFKRLSYLFNDLEEGQLLFSLPVLNAYDLYKYGVSTCTVTNIDQDTKELTITFKTNSPIRKVVTDFVNYYYIPTKDELIIYHLSTL